MQTIAELPTLDTLISGPIPPFPTEMPSAPDARRKLLDEARATYTHVVMDSPPLLSVTDSVVLARDTDAVVLLVRHGKSGKHAIRRARDLLLRAGAHISGIALNAVDLTSPEYYSYLGSGNHYAHALHHNKIGERFRPQSATSVGYFHQQSLWSSSSCCLW